MTQREWEKKLRKQLKKLPREENNKIIEYYREIYSDKIDAGFSNDAILHEFGFPEDCAARILSEDYGETAQRPDKKARTTGDSPIYIVGMVFLTLLIIIPLACAALGVVAGFASVSVSGIGIGLMGVVVIVWSPLQLTGTAILAGIGAGIASVGVGIMLFSGFFLLTKYTAIGCINALKWIYTRRI